MISYKKYEQYNEEEILNLYKSVGWSNYYLRPELLKKAYENSLKIIAAYEEDKLVGVIRVVGDGYSIIYVQDIIVIPEYQRQKIGTILLTKIMEEYKDVYQLVLLTDDSEQTASFYRSVGMISCVDYECMAFLKVDNV